MILKRLDKPMTASACAFLAAVFVAFALNVPFWQKLMAAVAPDDVFEWSFIASVAIGLVLALNLIFSLAGAPYFFKGLVAVVLPLTAGASYFMSEYGLPISTSLIVTAFETDRAEVRDLVTWKLIGYVLLLGVLPAALLLRQEVAWGTWRSRAWDGAKTIAASLAVIGILGLAFSNNFTSVFREQRHLAHYLAPYNVIASTRAALIRKAPAAAVNVVPYGRDAVANGPLARRGTRSLTVLVVGETARADHFALNGYARDTNPGLSKVDGLINVQSCGTLTADSLPCMFSGAGRAGSYRDIAARQENLLDIFNRAGIDVTWRDNQSGCKGVCVRVRTEDVASANDPQYCGTGECHDEILLRGLDQKLASLNGHAVVVLHMMGSHGPAYAKRYPRKFEAFGPACETSQFSRCTLDHIINAYDNTIRYTDHVLARLIEILGAADQTGVATAMLYVSDHGESLGEKNLFLHGVPFPFAPKEQTHVPMVLWLSKAFTREFGIEHGCVATQKTAQLRHDHYFHSVLGMLDISTSVRDDKLNIFRDCRRD
jgi:lipid A ethanolaminephosphotransferase